MRAAGWPGRAGIRATRPHPLVFRLAPCNLYCATFTAQPPGVAQARRSPRSRIAEPDVAARAGQCADPEKQGWNGPRRCAGGPVGDQAGALLAGAQTAGSRLTQSARSGPRHQPSDRVARNRTEPGARPLRCPAASSPGPPRRRAAGRAGTPPQHHRVLGRGGQVQFAGGVGRGQLRAEGVVEPLAVQAVDPQVQVKGLGPRPAGAAACRPGPPGSAAGR